tara:strand:+ start:3934 stop:5223 length:1290 start_codon:yes stop_codon:yes gene_type:complete
MKTNKIFTLSLTLTLVMLASLALVAADNEIMLCLTDGEVLEFSRCNPIIEDRLCESSSCQFCVTEITPGIFCPASLNACNTAGVTECTSLETALNTSDPDPDPEPEPSDLPVFTLESPADSFTWPEPLDLDFEFRVTKAFEVDSCSLVLNGESVSTLDSINSRTNAITHSIPEGSHTWNIQCALRSDGTTFDSDSQLLFIGSTQPGNETNTTLEITLNTPEDSQEIVGAQSLEYKFTLSENANLALLSSCEITLNDEVISTFDQSTLTASTDRMFSISHDTAAGDHTWGASCLDIFNLSTSAESTFKVTEPTITTNNPGGGGGGGGGSSGSSSSSDDEGRGASHRTKPTIGEVLAAQQAAKDAANSDSNDEPEVTEEVTEEPTDPAPITGAAIGTNVKRNVGIIVAVLAVLIAAFFFTQKAGSKVKYKK